MHEISVLKRAVDLAEQTAIDNNIDRIAYITLEVGELSGYLPVFFEKYFEVVIEDRPIFEGAELKMTWRTRDGARNAGPGTRRSSAASSSCSRRSVLSNRYPRKAKTHIKQTSGFPGVCFCLLETMFLNCSMMEQINKNVPLMLSFDQKCSAILKKAYY